MAFWRSTRIPLLVTTVSVSLLIGLNQTALGQVEPDETLGDERSQVREISPVDFDIEGGARRGNNLFHSFREFNVDEGGSVYFVNPDGVENILSRVTGGNPSNILGVLGVFGDANLFLINPNGIVFGPNAVLDVSSSFAATTASGIQFGEHGLFSATNPEVPSPLLTVNPSAFFFNQLNIGSITNRSVAFAGTIPPGVDLFGLRVPDGETLTLLGGNIDLEGGSRLFAIGGRVEIGAVDATGTVGLNVDGSLSFPTEIKRGDVVLTEASGVTVRTLSSGGDIAVTARTITLNGMSGLRAGIFPGQGSPESQAGDIVLNASERIVLTEASAISNTVFAEATGNGGDIEITAPILEVSDAAQLDATTFGQGDAGDVLVSASERVTLQGLDTTVFSTTELTASGNGGNIKITAPILELLDDAQLQASTNGQGNAGNVILSATDHIILRNGGVLSRVEEDGNGTGGNVEIMAPILEVLDDAQLSVSTFGQGNAGSIIISASDRVTFGRNSAALSRVNLSATGSAGNIEITAPTLEVLDGAQLVTSTFGQGNAGSIIISASDRATFRGASADGEFSSAAASSVEQTGRGTGGNIAITAPILEVLAGAQLIASTRGQGNAGSVIISASDRVTFRGASPDGFVSAALTTVEPRGSGTGGNIAITAPILEVLAGAQLAASTRGQGGAGSVIISASDRVIFRGTSPDGSRSAAALSTVEETGNGTGGNVEITAPVLEVLNGGQLRANTRGQGNAGNVIISAADRILLDGVGSSGFSSGVFISAGVNATGRGGRVSVTTPELRIVNRAIISALTSNSQPGGSVVIEADQFTVLNGGQVITSTLSSGRAGTITVNADRILLSGTDAAYDDRLQQFGEGVVANQGNRSGLFANTSANSTGNGGRITVNSNNLILENGAQISAQSQGTGTAGDIRLNVSEQLQLTDSDIVTTATRSSGGDISVNAGSDSGITILRGDSDITTNSQGNGGNITLQGSGIIAFDDSDILARSQDARGGNITLAPFFGTNTNFESDPPFDGNDRVNINADGSVAAGTITTPDTSFIQNSLTELPDTAIDTDTIVANSCVVRSQEQGGTFTITGSEGLPQRPGDATFPTYPTGEVRSIPESASDEPQSWEMGDPIDEPQGAYQLEDGRMVLSRECDNG